MKRYFSQSFTLLCAVVFLFSGTQLFRTMYDYRHNATVLAAAQEVREEAEERYGEADTLYLRERQKAREQKNELASSEVVRGTLRAEDNDSIRPQFQTLQQLNPEMIGWIRIDGTPIDYPILQAVDNDYYLYRNYKAQKSKAGSIFMDFRNDVSADDRNTVLYGHRLKDGSMFQSLTNFLDEDFFRTHRTIEFDTMYDRFDAEIFAVYYTTVDFDYIQTDFTTDEEYRALLEEIQEKSFFESDVHVTEEDRILTLSTCDYTLDPNEGRLVVHAKLKEAY